MFMPTLQAPKTASNNTPQTAKNAGIGKQQQYKVGYDNMGNLQIKLLSFLHVANTVIVLKTIATYILQLR